MPFISPFWRFFPQAPIKNPLNPLNMFSSHSPWLRFGGIVSELCQRLFILCGIGGLISHYDVVARGH